MQQGYAMLATAILMLMVVSCRADIDPPVTPRQILDEFYAYDGVEDTLMDPLIVGGQNVVPILLVEIRRSEMPKRRYAIGALGNIGDQRAVSVLEGIAADDGEVEYIRCDCVQAIALIDWSAGRDLAGQFARNPESDSESSAHCLRRVSARILGSSYDDWKENAGIVRSMEDAKIRRHN